MIRRTMLASLVLVCLCPRGAFAQAKPATAGDVQKLHQDPKAYIAMLDNPARDAEQKPGEVIAALGLTGRERVADIGAGSGYFTFRFASQLRSGGEVLAVDVSPDMIVHINQRVRDLGAANVRTILARPDDPLLATVPVDLVFICNTWHHIGDHARYLALLERALAPGGRVAIVDYRKASMPVGPPLEMREAREDVVGEFERAGFRLVREHDFLPYQYFLVFARAAGRGPGK
jgi:ubiquinone/menaquinone biosynthesis C-methylase UbiE